MTTTVRESERVDSTTALTIDHVAQIMPGARTNGLDREWQYFLKTCHDYEITTKNRLAAFLKTGQPIEQFMASLRSEDAAPGPLVGRNDPCPCGSGRKYKKCCLGRSAPAFTVR